MIVTSARPAPALYRRYWPLRLLGSIWFGIIVLALFLIYSSVFSAVAPVRWSLELTEMQAFKHWAFTTLAGLFCVSLIVITLFRSRWTWTNAGSLLAHVGLLTLMVGAFMYFGSKIEGDVLLQAPQLEIISKTRNGPVPVARIALVENETWGRIMPHRPEPLRVGVIKTRSSDGVSVDSADIAVQYGDEAPQMLRADAAAGVQAIDDIISVRVFTPPLRDMFYDGEKPALYLTKADSDTIYNMPIEGLPLYRERYTTDGEPLRDSAGHDVPSCRPQPSLNLFGITLPTGWFERWRMPIALDSEILPFDVTITGYVPAITSLQSKPGPDGAAVTTPVLVPVGQRRMDVVPRSTSAIRLHLVGKGVYAGWETTQWCAFSIYPEVEPAPLSIKLPNDGGSWQIIYARRQYPLGGALAAHKLWVKYFPGERGIESYHSRIAVLPPNGGGYGTMVETNHTINVGGWTLFQSGFSQDHWSYSILGVGNRHGIWTMLAGCAIVVAGCIFAFYIKPWLLRSRVVSREEREAADVTWTPEDSESGKDAHAVEQYA